jgi:hypothetical protein
MEFKNKNELKRRQFIECSLTSLATMLFVILLSNLIFKELSFITFVHILSRQCHAALACSGSAAMNCSIS